MRSLLLCCITIDTNSKFFPTGPSLHPSAVQYRKLLAEASNTDARMATIKNSADGRVNLPAQQTRQIRKTTSVLTFRPIHNHKALSIVKRGDFHRGRPLVMDCMRCSKTALDRLVSSLTSLIFANSSLRFLTAAPASGSLTNTFSGHREKKTETCKWRFGYYLCTNIWNGMMVLV